MRAGENERKEEKNNERYIISSTTIENKIKKAKIVSYSILSHTESGICNDLFHANEKKNSPEQNKIEISAIHGEIVDVSMLCVCVCVCVYRTK